MEVKQRKKTLLGSGTKPYHLFQASDLPTGFLLILQNRHSQGSQLQQPGSLTTAPTKPATKNLMNSSDACSRRWLCIWSAAPPFPIRTQHVLSASSPLAAHAGLCSGQHPAPSSQDIILVVLLFSQKRTRYRGMDRSAGVKHCIKQVARLTIVFPHDLPHQKVVGDFFLLGFVLSFSSLFPWK